MGIMNWMSSIIKTGENKKSDEKTTYNVMYRMKVYLPNKVNLVEFFYHRNEKVLEKKGSLIMRTAHFLRDNKECSKYSRDTFSILIDKVEKLFVQLINHREFLLYIECSELKQSIIEVEGMLSQGIDPTYTEFVNKVRELNILIDSELQSKYSRIVNN